jgi:hypothetical protein
MNFILNGIKIPHTIINIPSDCVYLGVYIYLYIYFLVIFFLKPLLSFPLVCFFFSPFPLLPFVNYTSLHRVLLVMRENALDMILKVVLSVGVLIIVMRTEKRYPTSKNI